MTREQLIEAMARAICNHWKNAKYYGDQWPEVSSHLIGQADDFRAKAAEALTAIEAAGLCIMPVEADTSNASYAFVESLIPRADQYAGDAPLWHGWALREAFIAGAAMVKAL